MVYGVFFLRENYRIILRITDFFVTCDHVHTLKFRIFPKRNEAILMVRNDVSPKNEQWNGFISFRNNIEPQFLNEENTKDKVCHFVPSLHQVTYYVFLYDILCNQSTCHFTSSQDFALVSNTLKFDFLNFQISFKRRTRKT